MFIDYENIRLKSDRNDFETHLLYVSLICRLSKKCSLTCHKKPTLKKEGLVAVKEKTSLIKLTKNSIDDENKIVEFDKEYSTASVLWLPIKTYYLVYHLMCVIDFLIKGDKKSLSSKHQENIENFNSMLENGELVFDKALLNQVFDNSILNFKTNSGEHFKQSASDELIYKLIMKKVAKEKVENYKIVNGLSARKKKEKERINRFVNGMKVSIFDFFYLMRLRTNYRNLNFIENVPSKDTKVYFEKYYSSADNFYKALGGLANGLIKKI